MVPQILHGPRLELLLEQFCQTTRYLLCCRRLLFNILADSLDTRLPCSRPLCICELMALLPRCKVFELLWLCSLSPQGQGQ